MTIAISLPAKFPGGGGKRQPGRLYHAPYGLYRLITKVRVPNTLYVGEKRAAEVMWHFGGKYVDGLDTKTAYLFWLGTNAPYRGQGLGRAMLRAALVSMVDAGAKATCLRCRPDNFAAHAVYRAEGYEVSDLLWEFRWRGEP